MDFGHFKTKYSDLNYCLIICNIAFYSRNVSLRLNLLK